MLQAQVDAAPPARRDVTSMVGSTAGQVASPSEGSAKTAADLDAPLNAAPAHDTEVIVVTAKAPPPPGDPLQEVNTVSFGAVQAVDKAIIGPVTKGYEVALPRQSRRGIHNFLNNLNEPIVFVNFVLQLNPAKAAETVARFAINSTLGAAGLFDVAKRKPFRLPRRANGVGDTLGFYGVPSGPYLFLPLIGSTTVRDMLGRMTDLTLLPTAIGTPFNRPDYQLASAVLSALDERSQFDDDLQKIRKSADPYDAMRAYYLKRRACEIATLHALKKRHGQPPSMTQVRLPGKAAEQIPCQPALPAQGTNGHADALPPTHQP